MKILLSNDDGIYAKGLNVLTEALRKEHEVFVVAPDRNRSGASNSLTLHAPLHVKELDNGIISVEGTPTDCVHLALTGLLDEQIDIVISGINEGPNLGDDILYSGTVAAATEGRYLGLPAIAISLAGVKVCRYYETAAAVIKQLIERLHNDPLPADTILNVNVPDLPVRKIKGFEVTRLGTRHHAEPIIKQTDPRGHDIYWVGPPGVQQDAGLGTDFYAISEGRVSVTPLKVDLTHYKVFDQVASWVTRLKL